MKILNLALAAGSCVISLALQGCFTMHVHNTGGTSGRSAEEWHHDGIFELVEFSSPVDLSVKCPGGWANVTQEESFLQGLVAGFTYSIYTPENVAWTCNKVAKAGSAGKASSAAKAAPAAPEKAATPEKTGTPEKVGNPPGDLNPDQPKN